MLIPFFRSVSEKTIKAIFQTILWSWKCQFFSLWRYQQPRHSTIKILLSWKSKLCDERRINTWNNRSLYLVLVPMSAILGHMRSFTKWHLWRENTINPLHAPWSLSRKSVFCTFVRVLWLSPCFLPSPQSAVLWWLGRGHSRGKRTLTLWELTIWTFPLFLRSRKRTPEGNFHLYCIVLQFIPLLESVHHLVRQLSVYS